MVTRVHALWWRNEGHGSRGKGRFRRTEKLTENETYLLRSSFFENALRICAYILWTGIHSKLETFEGLEVSAMFYLSITLKGVLTTSLQLTFKRMHSTVDVCG